MCKILEVCRSSYYDWLRPQDSPLKLENKQLAEKVKITFLKSRKTYGTRRIKRELSKEGLIVSRRRLKRIMQEQELLVKTKKKFKATTTDSKHSLPVAENLLNRNFSPEYPDTMYVGDITYIPTKEGWLYLAVVIDLFSRQVVGWSMDKHMKTTLVNNALLMALWKRKPAKGLVWHSDRGSQYASKSHREILKQYGIIQSMSRKGNCWDNSVSESFFHTLKVELIHHENFKTREEAKTAIFDYIETFYNRVRMHSANGYMSPVEYEMAQNF